MTRLLALDPGSKALGLAVFESGELKLTRTMTTKMSTPELRRLDMAVQLVPELAKVDKIASEEPHLMGRNAPGMERLLGMIEYISSNKVSFVRPTTLKKFMGGGKMEKLEMALEAGERVKTDKEKELIADAIRREAFDETDAVCVGLWWLDKGETSED